MSFDKQNFISNPNFKFQEYPAQLRECLGTTYTYDVYKSKEGKTILITPYWNIDKQCNTEGDPSVGLENYHFISLIDLSNNKEITTLVGHRDRVVTCRFFEDPFNGKQYLISADRKYQVKVWDLTDKGKIIFDKHVENYDNFIYSLLMIFDKTTIYVVVSTLGSGETCVYKIGDDQFIKKLNDTKDLNIYYLDYWYEEKDENENPEHHIIQLGKSNILITQLNKDKNAVIKVNEEKYANILCGMVFQKGGYDLLITSSTRGFIQLINLKEKDDNKRVLWSKEYPDVFFYNFVRWNDKYLLLYEALQRRILIFDTEVENINTPYKIVSKVLCPEMYFDRFIRKVDHPKYGESILSVGIDWRVKLYTNRNIVKEEKKEEKEEKEENKEGKNEEPTNETFSARAAPPAAICRADHHSISFVKIQTKGLM